MDEWFVESLATMQSEDDGRENTFLDGTTLSFEPFAELIGEAVPFLRANPCDEACDSFVYYSRERQEYGDYASIGGRWFLIDFKIPHKVEASNYSFVIGINVETRRLIVEVKEAYNKSSSDGSHRHNYSDVLEKALQYCVTAFVWLQSAPENQGENEVLALLSLPATMDWIQTHADCIKTLHWHIEETESILGTLFAWPDENHELSDAFATNKVFLETVSEDAIGQFHYVVAKAIRCVLQRKQPNFKCENDVRRFAFVGELAKHFTCPSCILLGYRDTPDTSWALNLAVIHKK